MMVLDTIKRETRVPLAPSQPANPRRRRPPKRGAAFPTNPIQSHLENGQSRA